ncbi:O-antigen ligase family protein [uncultured Winogradskyella sp.]|uniref:O-antigen ligase family protein n=1 Tax=uncultured Winogradskyella sp. TaxID=395353 RepID=UPI00262A074D|nr:O-antigen ligase family protein [uncultured Winogradskyella sp.]
MKLLIFLIKWGFPLLLVTDLSSELLDSAIVLNISRALRLVMLVLIVKENVLHYNIIKKFKFFRYFLVFGIVLFLYLFTDRDFFEGFWIYSKMLFWILGINVLFVYGFKNVFTLSDFIEVVKKVVVVAFVFTIMFYISGYIKTDYNVASYLVLFMYPLILLSTEGYSKNKFFVAISALAILITLKRGAMIAFALGNFVYYLGNLKNDFSFKKLTTGILIFLTLGFTGLYVFESQKDTIEDRFSEEQFDPDNEKAGSGRVGMYTRLYESWYNSDNHFFGFGNQEDSHRNVGRRTHAHSDIFGFLYNHGILGIILILILYIKVIKFYFSYRKYDKKNSAIILSLFAILVLVNFYSGMFRTTDAIYFFALLPYLQLRRDALKQSTYINQPT